MNKYKCFTLSLLTCSLFFCSQLIASGRGSSIPEEDKPKTGTKKRTERSKEKPQPKGEIPVKNQKQDDKESASPTPHAPKRENLKVLIETFEGSQKLQDAMTTIAGADLKKLKALAHKGNREAFIAIGIVSYMMKDSKLLKCGSSLDPFEFDEVCDNTFSYLSCFEDSDDPVAIRLLGLCYLSRPGEKNLIKGMQLLKRIKEKSRDKTIALKDEWNFRKRLLLVETGETKYLEGDEQQNKATLELIHTYAEEGHIGAQCIRANTLLKTSPEEALDLLISLATKQNNALAQWVLGRALFYGIGVKMNPDLGLKWIFKAAENKCPKAFLFMNSIIMQPQKKGEERCEFTKRAAELYQNAHLIFKRHRVLSDVQGYESICEFERRLSDELYGLAKLNPGFMVQGFNFDPVVLETLHNMKDSSFVYCNKFALSWGEQNVRAARDFDTLLGEVDALFIAYCETLKTFIEAINTKVAEHSAEEQIIEKKEIPKDRRKKFKLESKKKSIKEEIERLSKGLETIREDQGKLEELIQHIKELLPSTDADRKMTFMKALLFFRPL